MQRPALQARLLPGDPVSVGTLPPVAHRYSDVRQTPRSKEAQMAFALPELPYPKDALAPYMSAETLEYHHDKHHQAYVTNANKLIEGSGLEGKTLEEVVRGSF